MGREALARAPTDPAVAAQLALAAWRADPKHPAARDALARAYVGMRTVETELAGLSPEPIETMAVRGDTALLYTKPHPVAVTGVTGPAPQRHELSDLPPGSGEPVLSPDGQFVAITRTDRPVVVLRDLTGRLPPRELPGAPGTSLSLPVFAPGGDRLLWFAISADQTVRPQLWDLRANAEIPNRIGSIPRDVTRGWPTDDPGLVLLRHGTFGQDGTRLVVRSVADGTEVATLPPGTGVAPGSDAVLRVEEDPDFRAPSTVVVGPPSGAAPSRRLTAADVSLSWSRVSADGGWFLERRGMPVEGGYQVLRLSNLDTGETRQAIVPSIPERDASLSNDQRLSAATSLGVVSAGGRTSLLLAQGTSLLRFGTEPLPGGEDPPRRATISIDDAIVLAEYHTGVAVWDRRTGQQLGAVTGLGQNPPSPVLDGDTLWIMKRLPQGWEIGHYQLPTLRRIGAFQIPERIPDAAPSSVFSEIDLAADGHQVVISNGGWLAGYDRTTGQPLGAPVRLGTTPQEIRYSAAVARVWSRPGHPGQVAVKLNDGRTQLWEMPAGRLIHTFDTSTEEGPAFDPSGTRMALPNRDRAIEVWDVDQGVQVRPPIAQPDQATRVLGFQPDGYLVARANGPSLIDPPRLIFIDLESGRQAGAMRLTDDVGTFDPDKLTAGIRVNTAYGAKHPTPPHVRVAAADWRDTLCAVINRPFTESERLLLPPGSDPAPPCS
jgi:hypothetical protein